MGKPAPEASAHRVDLAQFEQPPLPRHGLYAVALTPPARRRHRLRRTLRLSARAALHVTRPGICARALVIRVRGPRGKSFRSNQTNAARPGARAEAGEGRILCDAGSKPIPSGSPSGIQPGAQSPSARRKINSGERAFYYQNDKALYGNRCGHAKKAEHDFNAHRIDEDGF